MLSKLKLDKNTLNCSKCDLRSSHLIELPCRHFLCFDCKRNLKFRIFFHCRTLRAFLHSKNEHENFAPTLTLSVLMNRLAKAEKEENYILNICKNRLLSGDFGAQEFFNSCMSCRKCEQSLNTSKNAPITLTCFHTICKECYDESEHPIECSLCSIKSSLNRQIFPDKNLLEILRKLEQYSIRKHFSLIESLEISFAHRLDEIVSDLKETIIPNRIEIVHDVILRKESSCCFRREQKLSLILNRKRNELLNYLDQKMKENLNKMTKNDFVYYRKSHLDQHGINSFGNLRFKTFQSFANKLRQLHLNNGLACRSFHLESKNITKPLIRLTGFNWLRQAPKPDYLIPVNNETIISIYPHDSYSTEYQAYRLKIASLNLDRNAHLEYEFNFEMKLEYCRFDAESNRLGLFFERAYDKEYCFKVYNLNNLSQAECEKSFQYFIENFIFSNANEILSWSSLNSPYVRFFSAQLVEQLTPKLSQTVFSKFYALSDANDSFLVCHNQDTIGVICRIRGALVYEINIKEYEKQDDWMQNEMHRRQRMRLYQSRSKSEYLNLKLLSNNSEHLLVSTWCKIYLFDLANGGELLAKNSIFLIPNNNWLLPNRVYANRNKDKNQQVAFFDNSTSFLTFF